MVARSVGRFVQTFCNSYFCGGLDAYMKTGAAAPTRVIAGEGDEMRTSPVLTPYAAATSRRPVPSPSSDYPDDRSRREDDGGYGEAGTD
jgi:hypothetical protein